ncbi:calcium-binding protein [Microvirga sp. ACRRW]|uniref:calcium-binding protein n=1 Tax=Microvirga sp. ACRRW TaxID=2918205 RepID=UPI00272CD9DC|nr:calcium-binding protein [Microvirga sp. ACRRW]
MAYIQFFGNLPTGLRIKDLFVSPATDISLTQDITPNIATFSVKTKKGGVPVTYYGSGLTLAQGSVSAITFGSDHKPWLTYGSAADTMIRLWYGNGLAAFHGNGALAAATALAGADYMRGSSKGDYIDGYAGDDTLNGGGGNDTMVGGTGNDIYYVGSVADRIFEYHGAGRDVVIASVSYKLPTAMEIEVLQASKGLKKLTLTGNSFANLIIGSDGANALAGGGGRDTLEGGRGNDTYVINDARTVIIEKAAGGTDTVRTALSYTLTKNSAIENLMATGYSAVRLTGNEGKNTISGNDAENLLKGLGGNDILYGGLGGDTIQGGSGNDALYGGNGLDRLYGEAGNDTLYGGSEDGFLFGGSGNDVLYGYWNNDLLYGDTGNDILHGHTGNDTLNGGLGRDTLSSGEGYDIIVFDTRLGGANIDAITDFNPWADQIRLKLSIFSGIGRTGRLSNDQFWIGAKAHTASDRIIYDKSAGALSYDPDGTGAAPQIKFAIVGQIELSAAAFLVI